MCAGSSPARATNLIFLCALCGRYVRGSLTRSTRRRQKTSQLLGLKLDHLFILTGENPFKLQRILGHETLEMTRRYVDLVALEAAVKGARRLPVFRFQAGQSFSPHFPPLGHRAVISSAPFALYG